MKTNAFIFFTILLIPFLAFARSSTMNTGEILAKDKYRISAETQFVTQGETTGANVISRLDFAVNHESEIRLETGIGTTDYQAGVYYKWIPYPSYGRQPAVGGIVGMSYYSNSNEASFSFSATPIVSQRFNIPVGEATVYASLPIDIISSENGNQHALQATIGSELKIKRFKRTTFNAEFGFNMHNSSTYFGVGANFYFDKILNLNSDMF